MIVKNDLLVWRCDIDWITLSYKPRHFLPIEETYDARDAAYGIYECIGGDEETWSIKPAKKQDKNYKWTFDTAEGYRISISDDPAVQGHKLVLPGQTHFTGGLLKGVYDMLGFGGKITRIDVALDLFYNELGALDYVDMYKAAEPVFATKAFGLIDKPHHKEFNIGGRTSAYYGRCYDKGLQQGSDLDWVRFELELKQYAAEQLGPDILLNVHGVLPQLLEYFRMRDSELGDHLLSDLGNSLAEIGKAVRPPRLSNRERWFDEQVIPAFKKLAAQDAETADRVFSKLLSAYDDVSKLALCE